MTPVTAGQRPGATVLPPALTNWESCPCFLRMYLHYVLDLWVDHWRKTQARGNVIVTRFADDFIAGFQHQDDAERFPGTEQKAREVQPGTAPRQTRLIEFGPHAARNRKVRGEGKPETFTFLGFRHIARMTRQGRFWVQRITDNTKMTAMLKSVKAELMKRRRLPVPEQGRWLASVIRGHEAYYAVPGNAEAVAEFRYYVTRHWRFALSRAAREAGSPGSGCPAWPDATCPRPGSGTLGPKYGSPPGTHDRSPVREFRSLGSVRGGASARTVPTATS